MRYRRYCFNPRARDGRDSGVDPLVDSLRVSIHAPVMDAIKGDAGRYAWIWFQSTRP